MHKKIVGCILMVSAFTYPMHRLRPALPRMRLERTAQLSTIHASFSCAHHCKDGSCHRQYLIHRIGTLAQYTNSLDRRISNAQKFAAYSTLVYMKEELQQNRRIIEQYTYELSTFELICKKQHSTPQSDH